jgi:uncharacterized protein YecE (DUF72 family)
VYSRIFDAVELDTTFYATPSRETVQKWYASTPENFRFTAKTPRSITHDRRLVDARGDWEEFLEAIGRLGDKLGAVLLQLPPDFTTAEEDAFQKFLPLVPRDLPLAVEVRHRSWHRDSTFELLKAHGIAWAITDLSYMPVRVELTAPFTYIRWLGDRRQIQRVHAVQIDRTARLTEWARTIDEIALRDVIVYGFVNNHYSGHSPADVRYLRAQLGLPGVEMPGHPVQRTLL